MKYFRVKFDCKELYTKDSPTFCFSKYLSVLKILSEKILKMFIIIVQAFFFRLFEQNMQLKKILWSEIQQKKWQKSIKGFKLE